ncbi:MAG: imidazolonepropionase [Gammaproteobacteria bacterium]|nr:imidazolonepropionase [Gammaproteobacteria bacterium]
MTALVIERARLVTGTGGPLRGAALGALRVIEDAAVAVAAGRIREIGSTRELAARHPAAERLDAAGRALLPGLVDCHTHVVYAGSRIGEFERRLAGESYQQIAASGGGILVTVAATRAAGLDRLVDESTPRLRQMLRLGTTAVEIKSGYGLDLETELRMLAAIERLDAALPLDLVPTLLAAHVVPPEYAGRAGDYVDHVIDKLLPAARQWHARSRFAARGVPLACDVFCERGTFDVAQSRRLLAAARALGLPVRAHVDQFEALGGLDAALDLAAVSVDHLEASTPESLQRLARSSTVGVVMPAASFHLGQRYANARALVDAGGLLALCTDCNPGSAPCPSLPLAMAIACRYQKLRPAEALNAATVNAAHVLGLGAEVGSVEVGKQADLLLLDCRDWRELAYSFGGNPVAAVVKNGRLV